METVFFVGKALDVTGKILLGVAVYKVHDRLLKEHRIDQVVFEEIKHERFITLIGIFLIVIGFLLQLPLEVQLFAQ